jgi:hypothetical protein
MMEIHPSDLPSASWTMLDMELVDVRHDRGKSFLVYDTTWRVIYHHCIFKEDIHIHGTEEVTETFVRL